MPSHGSIPREFIDQLTARADIVEVISRVTPLKRKGKDYMGLCPFHDEKTPSFTVSSEKQLYYCFGCGAGGDTLQFIARHHHCGFATAVEHLAAQYSLTVPRIVADPQHAAQHRETRNRQQRAYDLIAQLAQRYHRQLQQYAQDTVGAYLQQRKIEAVSCQRFLLGYAADADLHAAFPEAREAIEMLDLMRSDAQQPPRDRMHRRLIFPIHDPRGQVVGFGGRALSAQHKPKYLNSPDSIIFQKKEQLYGLYQALSARGIGDEIVVVEGYMDVVMLTQHGVQNAVATLGTALGEAHLRLLWRYVSRLVFCFDGDAAGRRAAQKAMFTAIPFLEDGRVIRFVFLENDSDPDDFIRSQGCDAWYAKIREATPLSDYFIRCAEEKFDLASLESRAHCAKSLTPHLQQLPVGAFRDTLFARFAARLQMEVATLQHYDQPSRAAVDIAAAPKSQAKRSAMISAAKQAMSLYQRTIGLIYINPQWLSRLPPQLLADFAQHQNPALRAIHTLIYQLCEQFTENGVRDDGFFLGYWQDNALCDSIRRALEEPVHCDQQTLEDTLQELLRQDQQRHRASRIRKLSAQPFQHWSAEERKEWHMLLEKS